MEPLICHLLEFGPLNPPQIAFIERKALLGTTQKGACYRLAGHVAQELIFLTQGLMRVYYYSRGGQEVTSDFLQENCLIGELNRSSAGMPSTEYIQALTDCRYVVLSKRSLEELSVTIIGWDALLAQVTAKAIADQVNRASVIMAQDGRGRYARFVAEFPALANRIPSADLSAYLGGT